MLNRALLVAIFRHAVFVSTAMAVLTMSACNRPSVQNSKTSARSATGDSISSQPSPPETTEKSKNAQNASASSSESPTIRSTQPADACPYFEQADGRSGIDFVREDDIGGQRRIFESTGGGVGMSDFDNDGNLDLIYTGGCKLPLTSDTPSHTCALFRSVGATQFTNSTLESRLLQPGYCQGISVADFDNDGFDDVYMAAFGKNALWHNRGDGTFVDVTEAAGVSVSSWSTSCAFGDIDVDGNLDLYVVNYLKEDAESPLRCPNPRSPDGFEQCPPAKYEGVDDVLFMSKGDGTFMNATTSAGLDGLAGKGLGLAISDFDKDGRPEIYVANDGEANFLFKTHIQADKTIRLENRGMMSGAALSHNGYAQASMGVAAGDFDDNGGIDLFLTNFYGDSSTLYKNIGQLQFEDCTRSTALVAPSRSVLGWGTVFADLNNDGKLDLFVANGHVEDRQWLRQGEPYKMPPQVFVNQGGGKFGDCSRHAGAYFNSAWLGRGVAHGDLDRDGRIDLAISHQLDPSSILFNRTVNVEPLITVRLVGTRSNRSAIVARIEALNAEGDVFSLRELTGGTTFQSSVAKEIYLSPPGERGKSIRITWPSGLAQVAPYPTETILFIEPASTDNEAVAP